MNVASLIKAARIRAGLSQNQAAKAWGIPADTIRSWEQGQRQPGGKHLAKILPLISPDLNPRALKRKK